MTFDVQASEKYWKSRNLKESESLAERVVSAHIEAIRLAALLKSEALVAEVVLFGSLAEGQPTRGDFDIDLAIKGGDFLKALRLAQSTEFQIDLADYEDLPDHVRRRIDRCGQPL